MSCHVMSSDVKWCDAMGWHHMRLWWDVVGCEVMQCDSKRLCCVMWRSGTWCTVNSGGPMSQSTIRTTKSYSVLQQKTKCHSIQLKYCKVLRCIYPYNKYSLYSVLQSTLYYGLFFRAIKYYPVLLPNPFDSHNTWNVHYITRRNLWDAKTRWNYDIHVW